MAKKIMGIFWGREKNAEKRFRLISKFVKEGKVLEIGGSDIPNPYLPKGTIMLDFLEPKRELPPNYTRFIKGNALMINNIFKKKEFDCIVATEVIEHIPDHCEFLFQIYDILKPGGRLILTSPNPFFLTGILGNLFFPKGFSESGLIDKIEGIKGPYYGHIHLHIPRIINQISSLIGFEIEEVRYFLGPFRILSASVLYVFKK